ncbi:hypothetical protein HID58_092187 [Brassica napus]|uniref:Uncharacterized protein n=1 Tax=Brassica napus TaxID=3708 RepID=A0ABQ7WX77_BRANA|nr:hypothetical protein HID58_092187 [Brassica napus]
MKKESNLAKLVKSPVRFLIMARDAYIRSMTSCSAGYIRGGGGSGGFGLPAGNFQICEEPSTTLPRSFTLNSSTTTVATRERCGLSRTTHVVVEKSRWRLEDRWTSEETIAA